MATDVERVAASELADLLPTILSGGRLSRRDCLRLWQTADLTSLGVLANQARERVSGSVAFFRSAIHVNPTGRPDPACPECAAAAVPGCNALSPERYYEILGKVGSACATELHLAGGPDRAAGVDDLCRLVEQWVTSCPQTRLRAFTWQQLECAAERDCKSPAEVLSRLADAGLASPAGGALVDLSPSHPHLDHESIAAMERRVPWIQAAADLGLKCELSLIFGDGDDSGILADLLVCIRGIQDSYSIFECFVPLAFSWPADALDLPLPTGYNHLRTVAIGRLFLDNVRRVRCSPFAVGEPLAQIAQWYGADDAGSASASGRYGDQSVPTGRHQMLKLLRQAGRDPVEI